MTLEIPVADDFMPHLPRHLQQEFSQQIQLMQNTTAAVMGMLNGVSLVHQVAVSQVLSTVHMTRILKAGYQLTETEEKWFERKTDKYLQLMEQIPEQHCQKVVEVLEGMATSPDKGDWLDDVIYLFKR